MKRIALTVGSAVALATALVVFLVTPSASASTSVTYRGQGLIADGFGGYDLITELCGVQNGADVDGPYLLWVLTATGATTASISGPWGTAQMTQSGGGAFKYISGWYAPGTLPGTVSATYDGKAKNAQLVISHGCRPFTHGAWCSPGFWMNAEDAAWALTGHTKTDAFNSTVVPNFYDTALGPNPTLGDVLTPGPNYKTPASGPYGLTPFNATGAYLTDNIPGYDFDASFVSDDDSQTCPIDHHGNFK